MLQTELPPRPAASATAVTVFERMSRLARDHGAINLGQGFPDLPEPEELLEAAARALVSRSNQYPPMRGLPELRQAIAGYYRDTQGLDIDAGAVVVTSGATEALAAAILATVRPGDEVLLVPPLYDAYLPLVQRAGGVARFVPLTPPGWELDPAALAAAVTERTRVLILNTPNNPTGTVLDASALDAVAALCTRHDIVLICDEVWESTLIAGQAHRSPLAVEGLRERTIKIGSAGKIFALTGWKVGWAVAAPALADAVAAQHQFLTFTTAPALQWAVRDGLALPEDWHRTHASRYAQARQRLVSGLEGAGYDVLPNVATWFVTVDLRASGIALDDEDFCQRAVTEAGVAAIPVSAFYPGDAEAGYVRLCFAKRDETLDAAIARLAAFRRSLA